VKDVLHYDRLIMSGMQSPCLAQARQITIILIPCGQLLVVINPKLEYMRFGKIPNRTSIPFWSPIGLKMKSRLGKVGIYGLNRIMSG